MLPVPLLAARRASRPCCTCLLADSPKAPSRPRPSPRAPPQSPSTCRFFRATLALRTSVEETARKNHYERLGVRHDASPADIKRSFYRLSKSHHPDANPSDPTASDRFSLLSESYTLLSDPSRRAAYDRDVLRLHAQHHSHHVAHPRGSYSSASHHAGGRSPSGLSRRRTTFRGPPPSFYRSGGWGAHGEKRKKAHDESTGFNGANASEASSSSSPSSSYSSAGTSSSQHPGMGPGSDPFSHRYSSDPISHFNEASHKRTHEREDLRRENRQKHKARRAWGDDDIEFEPQASLVGHFVIVSGILAVTFLAPFLYLKMVGERKRAVKPGERY